jgi:hypothetical protein
VDSDRHSASDIVDELRRRKVLRTTTIYAVTGWCLLQIATVLFPRMGVPDWAATMILTAVVLGFPVVVALSWVFDITPDGVQRAEDGKPDRLPPRNRVVDGAVVLLLLLTLVLLYWNGGG